MVIRRLAVAIGLLFALVGSQAPEFAEQYRQRLSGMLDELQRVISQFDAEAAQQTMTRQEGIEKLKTNPDTLAQLRAEALTADAARLDRLSRQKNAMENPGPINRLVGMVENFDPDVASAAISNYEPALPLTFEAFALAGLALFFGWVAVHLVFWPFRPSRRSGRQPENAARSSLQSSLAQNTSERESQAGIASEYRGYRFKFSRTDRYVATIWAPRSLQCLSVKPTASLREGEGVLISRVQGAIDREIDRQAGTTPTRASSSSARGPVALLAAVLIAASFIACFVFVWR